MTSLRRGLGVAAAFIVMSQTSASAAADAATCAAASENGQRSRTAGKLREARALFMGCSSDCPSLIAHDCATWASEVLAAMPSIVIDATDRLGHDVHDASVIVDGELVATSIDGKAIPVDPGEHTIVLEQTHPLRRVSETIVAKEGATTRQVKLVFPDGSADAPASHWSAQRWAGVGLGVAGVAVTTIGAVILVSYKIDSHDLDQQVALASKACGGQASCIATKNPDFLYAARRSNARQAQADKDAPIVTTMLIGGPLLLVGGLVLFLTATPAAKQGKLQLAPIVSPSARGMSLSGAF